MLRNCSKFKFSAWIFTILAIFPMFFHGKYIHFTIFSPKIFFFYGYFVNNAKMITLSCEFFGGFHNFFYGKIKKLKKKSHVPMEF